MDLHVHSNSYIPVMGNLDEEVVDLMRADVVHEIVSPAVVAVHGAEVAADKVPLLVNVPRHILVLVVQERRDDQPRGEGEDGQEVVEGQVGQPEGESVGDEGEGDEGGPAGDAHHARSRASSKERVEGVEVEDLARLVPVAGHEVSEPSTTEPEEGCKSALLVRLLHPDRVKNLILVYVSSVLVMMVMGHLPWVIGNL